MMTPLSQRLHDKTKADLAAFRNELTEWHLKQAGSGFLYTGRIVDAFWQMCRNHLQGQISAYFEWVEKEGAGLSPSTLRRNSVHQCIGAIVSYSNQVRSLAVEKNRIFQQLDSDVDFGRWDDVDKASIVRRGARLLDALGVGSETPWTERLNQLSKDHQWLFNLIAIIAFLMSLILAVRQV